VASIIKSHASNDKEEEKISEVRFDMVRLRSPQVLEFGLESNPPTRRRAKQGKKGRFLAAQE
jgi:hypothetical protein